MRLPDHWFYTAAAAQPGASVEFDALEAAHATKVLRLRSGDGLQWVDGRGGRHRGRISEITRAAMSAVVDSTSTDPPTSPLRLHVGILHDATRLEWLVEKATELGATQVSLLQASRVQRVRYRRERLEAKVLAAVKQSGRAYLPTLAEQSFAEAVSRFAALGGSASGALAHCHTDRPRLRLSEAGAGGGVTDLFIGPEGDFTGAEIDAAAAAGIVGVSIGKVRLRTETAALAALAVVALR